MICYFNKRILLLFLLIVVIVVLHMSGVTSYLAFENIQYHVTVLRTFVYEHYWFSVFIYSANFIVTTVLFIPVTIVLTVLAGYLFGILPGLFYALLSATLGCIIIFLLVRYVLGNIVEKRLMRYVAFFREELEERGYSYLLMLQLLPVTPTPLINITAGLLPISLWTFSWTTFLGLLPGSLFYVIAGRQFVYISSLNDILSWPMITILVALAIIVLFVPYALRYIGFVKKIK